MSHGDGVRATSRTPATAVSVRPVHVADLVAEGELMPVHVHVIEHPDARVLVDTGLTELHPPVADLDPRVLEVGVDELDPASIDVVVNPHLHFDHCGGNHRYAGKTIYAQRRELEDVRNLDTHTIRALHPEQVWLSHEHRPWHPASPAAPSAER